jgi:hypothetical protein
MALADFLSDDEEIYRRSLGTENEYGEAAETWTKIATIKGTIQPRAESQDRNDLGKSVSSDGVLYVLAGANIKVDDRVKDPSGEEWIVNGILDESNRHHHYKVSLTKVE